MLRHDIRGKRGRIAADLDLEIAGGVARVERTDQRKNRVQDGLAAGEFGEIEPELGAGGREIEESVFREGRRQRIRVAVVEAEG
jgi:hypothetical protein